MNGSILIEPNRKSRNIIYTYTHNSSTSIFTYMLVSYHCSNKLSELPNKFGGLKQYKFTDLEATTLR